MKYDYPYSLKRKWLALLGALCIGLAACAGNRSSATRELALTETVAPVSTHHVTATPPPTLVTSTDPSLATIAYPLSTATFVPYPTPWAIPSALPTPIVNWAVEVIEATWQSYGTVNQPGWESNTVAKLAVYIDPHSNTGKVVVDISAGKAAVPISIPDPPVSEAHSPGGTYLIRCDNGLQLYRTADNQLLSETAITPPLSSGTNCRTYVEWAPDKSAVAIVAGDWGEASREIYVWRIDGSAPQKVANMGRFGSMAWAPDSRRLAFVQSYNESTLESVVAVITSDGHALGAPFNIGKGYDGGPALLSWFTDDVLANNQRYGLSLFQASTGQFLLYWEDIPTTAAAIHQYPETSPDQRWVTVDQGNFTPDYEHVRKGYSLYDIQSKTEYVLANTQDNYLKFNSWKDDSSILYLVSRPANATAISGPNTPFGLLAFDPATRIFDLLFKDAVKVEWNPDKSRAFVVFPIRQPDGTVGLAGGIWKAGSTELIGRQLITEQMIYQDPAWGTFFVDSSDVLPAAWSHDGARVVFGNSQNEIIVLNTGGKELKLTTTFPPDEWKRVAYRWSPDDRHILIQYDERAWIITVP